MREAEILRDQLLACFEQMPGLQPRHIQVQTADLNEYAPYIEAVFATDHPNARDAIPLSSPTAWLPAKAAFPRPAVAGAVRQPIPRDRLLELLRCDGLARQFGFPRKIFTWSPTDESAGLLGPTASIAAAPRRTSRRQPPDIRSDRLFPLRSGRTPPNDARPTVIPDLSKANAPSNWETSPASTSSWCLCGIQRTPTRSKSGPRGWKN